MTVPESINVADAKARFAELVQRASRGEEIIIARNGEPQARLVPLRPRLRIPGSGAGQYEIEGDFNQPLPHHVLADFEASAP